MARGLESGWSGYRRYADLYLALALLNDNAERKALTTPSRRLPVAVADPRLQQQTEAPPQSEAPTQETGTLPKIPDRERRRASMTMPRLAAGRYLAVEDGGDVVLMALNAPLMRIGRSPASEIVLDDASVSRRHALITQRGEKTVILDDRSRNGLHVNGARVSEAELHDGDTIVCGHVTLRYVERVE
ncbi:MAG TPA: FHA domain-containing protein [Solirubrobacter sp.]|nr:FHA domain-containing protein [Solirubrobacter sp.]